mmetsp:Transcript_10660/g.29555  ORF Transcript_10660/g.29555 Transcript_10660/m.29555 type:complete len:309 (+) Transcript_10660:568-1494(+)
MKLARMGVGTSRNVPAHTGRPHAQQHVPHYEEEGTCTLKPPVGDHPAPLCARKQISCGEKRCEGEEPVPHIHAWHRSRRVPDRVEKVPAKVASHIQQRKRDHQGNPKPFRCSECGCDEHPPDHHTQQEPVEHRTVEEDAASRERRLGEENDGHHMNGQSRHAGDGRRNLGAPHESSRCSLSADANGKGERRHDKGVRPCAPTDLVGKVQETAEVPADNEERSDELDAVQGVTCELIFFGPLDLAVAIVLRRGNLSDRRTIVHDANLIPDTVSRICAEKGKEQKWKGTWNLHFPLMRIPHCIHRDKKSP